MNSLQLFSNQSIEAFFEIRKREIQRDLFNLTDFSDITTFQLEKKYLVSPIDFSKANGIECKYIEKSVNLQSAFPFQGRPNISRPRQFSQVTVQFKGNKDLLKCTPTSYTTSFPFASKLSESQVEFEISGRDLEIAGNTLEENYVRDETLRIINNLEFYINNLNEDISKFNKELFLYIDRLTNQRKTQIEAIEESLDRINPFKN